MIITPENLKAVFTGLKTEFSNAFSAAPSQWEKIAMRVKSTTAQEDYAWLSNFPRMREWIGAKHIKNLATYKYSIPNKPFEATIEVERDKIEDDQLGIYGPQAQMAGWSAKQLPDEIVFKLLVDGFTSPCFDGQYFFDTDHDVGGTSVSNRGSAPLSNATAAAAAASFGAARTSMMKYQDEEGRSLNIMPDTVVVGPMLADIINALMTNDRLADGSPNPYKGACKVVVDGRITSDTAWFLLDTSKPVKPMIYQERKAPVFVSQVNMEASDVFERAVFKFGAEARAAGGYGFWQMAYGTP